MKSTAHWSNQPPTRRFEPVAGEHVPRAIHDDVEDLHSYNDHLAGLGDLRRCSARVTAMRDERFDGLVALIGWPLLQYDMIRQDISPERIHLIQLNR